MTSAMPVILFLSSVACATACRASTSVVTVRVGHRALTRANAPRERGVSKRS